MDTLQKIIEMPQRLDEITERLALLERLESRLTAIEERIGEACRPNAGKDVMTTAEAAEYLGLTEKYVRRLTSERRIPFCKREGSNRNAYRRADLDEWRTADKHETEASLLRKRLLAQAQEAQLRRQARLDRALSSQVEKRISAI